MLGTALLLAAFAAISSAIQLPLALNRSAEEHAPQAFKRLITPELSAYAERLIAASDTPGLSLGVVQFDRKKLDIQTEFGAWGTRSEDGDKTTPDVGHFAALDAHWGANYIVDPFRHWFLFQGIPGGCHGYSHR